VQFKSSLVISLLILKDPEGCAQITIEPSTLNGFVEYSQSLNRLTITPTLPFHLGEFTVSVVLSDNFGLNKPYPFTLVVYDYPRFSSTVKTQVIKMNSVATLDLPIIKEFTPITVIFSTTLPAFINFAYPTFTFSPAKKNDKGEFLI
jgi:hypothetical protein